MVILCGEGGVAVAQPVHHGDAGDDDGSEQSADAVLEGWKLTTTTKKGKSYSYRTAVKNHTHSIG